MMFANIKLCCLSLSLIMALVVSSGVDEEEPSRSKDIVVAAKEMERANYFAFVMLMNMAPPDLFEGNVTFLMPNDRSLSKTVIPENNVADFLLRHSIPSPMLFDHLLHIPTNTLLPTSNRKVMLRVSNDGRMSFYLNNVRVVSPNICTEGYSVRCHGVDGAVEAGSNPRVPPSPICRRGNGTTPPAAPPVDWSSLRPSAAPPPPRKTSSPACRLASRERFLFLIDLRLMFMCVWCFILYF